MWSVPPAQAEPWDGRDEAGNLVPPGSYTVKGIAHQPLHLAYRGTVNVSGNPPWNTSNYNQRGPGGWLSDHEPPNNVTAIGDLIFVSAQVAESGHGILACDLDGNKLWGTHRFGGPNGLCYAGFLAHDGGKVYTAGIGWGSYLGINDRQYMVADPRGEGGPLLLIGEFRTDRVVPLAVVGNADRWWPLANDPALRRLTGDRRLEELSFAWSDRDGDGQPQPGEVELFDLRLDPTYWPTVANARLEVQMGGRVLKPVEFTACGAPVYKPLAATPHKLPAETVYATAIDRQGRVLINGNPLTSLDATGNVAWKYYLVAGHHHNSVVELTGLETMRRLESKMTVSGDDLAAVEAWRMRRDLTAARKAVPKVFALTAPRAGQARWQPR